MDILTCLQLVRQNMDEIPVTGIRNQDLLVGCAWLLDQVIKALEEAKNAGPEKTPEKEQETKDG